MKKGSNVIPIAVHLPEWDSPMFPLLEKKLQRSIAGIAEQLGITAVLQIEMKKSNNGILKLYIHNSLCDHRSPLLAVAINDAQRENTDLGELFMPVADGYRRNTDTKILKNQYEPLAVLYEVMVLVMIKMRPSCLMGYTQMEPFLNAIKLQDQSLDQSKSLLKGFYQCFCDLLDLRISMPTPKLMSTLVNQSLEKNPGRMDLLLEELIDKLSSKVILVEVQMEYFRMISESTGPQEDLKGFELMREGLFHELGILYPNLQLKFNEEIPFGYFRFVINDLETLSFKGLDKDEYLVNATASDLKQNGTAGIAVINPANGLEHVIIKESEMARAGIGNWTNWNPNAYMVLSLAAALRPCGKCFVHKTFINEQLDRFSEGWPQLVEALEKLKPTEYLTQIFRTMVRHKVSIRDFRSILEAIVEEEFQEINPDKYVVFDQRFPLLKLPSAKSSLDTVQFIRNKLKDQLTNAYSKGGDTLYVFLLDKLIEARLQSVIEDNASLSEEYQEKLLKAMGGEIITSRKQYQSPVILTSSSIAGILRKIIEFSFPAVQVLSYNELVQTIKVQPLSRIVV